MSGVFGEHRRRGVSWLTVGLLEECGLDHGFTLRRGGASRGGFASLNFTSRQGDLPERVRENWRRLEAAAGLSPGRWSLLRQVHGAEVVDAGSGAPAAGRARRPEADGLVAAGPEVTLGILTADCLPVLISLPGGGCAAAHAGWRGTLAGVAVEAARRLALAAGVSTGEMTAGLGPCIGRCCYNVGEEVYSSFRERWGAGFARRVFTASDPWRFDLQEANRLQLLEAGLRRARVGVLPLCTCCRKDLFFSHRRDGARTGRMVAFAVAGRGREAAGKRRRSR